MNTWMLSRRIFEEIGEGEGRERKERGRCERGRKERERKERGTRERGRKEREGQGRGEGRDGVNDSEKVRILLGERTVISQ